MGDTRHDLRLFTQTVNLRLLHRILLDYLNSVGTTILRIKALKDPPECSLAKLPYNGVELLQFLLQCDFRGIAGILHYLLSV